MSTRTEGIARMRDSLWEFLRHETDPQLREIVHAALVSRNSAWVPRAFDFVGSVLPPPAPLPIPVEAPLFYRPRAQELTGDVYLGATEDGLNVWLPLTCFGPLGDGLVAGIKGSGKSTLLQSLATQLSRLLNVTVFDTENEHAHALLAAGSFLFLPFEDYRRNLFEGPPNLGPEAWLETVKDTLREDLQLEDPALNLLSEVCASIRRRGVSLTLPRLLDELRSPAHRGSSQKALINRLIGLRNSTGAVFSCEHGIDFARLSKKSIVFGLENTGTGVRGLFYHDMYSWLARSREARRGRELRDVWVFDEAHTLFSRLLANRNDIAEPLSLQMFRMARKRGIGIVVGDQIPNLEHPVVRGNLGLKILFRLTDPSSVALYGRALGLSLEQQNALMNLPPRMAVVHHPLIPSPFLVRVPHLALPVLTDQELEHERLRTIAFLDLHDEPEPVAEAQPVPMASPVPGDPPEVLTHEAQNYLVDVARDPYLEESVRDEQLGLSGWKGNRLRSELLKAGFVEEVVIRPGRKGRPPKALDITQAGREFLASIAVTCQPRGKGGFLHRFSGAKT